ncbi:phosphatidate cytidylyltransferase [Hazenella coriacea]|uniref:Phosphatidate cytidylyltransferase n=1 Tax=Hazenella coriacea TaxID=1179467 RepID=A0A4R3L0X4_9BACL|nr:phosphatidate cytidylyltransferase [Hazenella coriacea]TCS93171.1 phosphatidate cytidylyltransferase [Hazenella coriacea]
MKQRIITGVIGASGFLLLLWLGSWWYTSLLFLSALIGFIEFAQMKQISWKKPQVLLGLLTIGLIFLHGLAQQETGFLERFQQMPDPVIIGLVLYLIFIVLSRNHFDIHQMAFLFVGAVYIGIGFSYMMQMVWKPNGFVISLLVIFITWSSDSGAYFIGRKWGKKKLWPQISPNKTMEGSIAGIVSGILISIFMFMIIPELGGLFTAMITGLMISIAGQMGDLIESAWKRTMGIKDSGSLLPGHGGVLDRFDSLLFSFIVLHIANII